MDGPKDHALPYVECAPDGALTFWDKVNLSQWGLYLSRIEETAVRRAHALSIKRHMEGVDLGCGSGRWSQLLSNMGWRMTCIDIDEDVLSICRRNTPNSKIVLTERGARSIPSESNSAGILLCIEAPLLDMNWFLAEANRILIREGLLLGVWWNSSSWRALAWRANNRSTEKGGPANFYTSSYSSWKKRLAVAGFEILHDEGYCWPPFGRESNSNLIPFFSRFERAVGFNRCVNWSPWVIFIARKGVAK